MTSNEFIIFHRNYDDDGYTRAAWFYADAGIKIKYALENAFVATNNIDEAWADCPTRNLIPDVKGSRRSTSIGDFIYSSSTDETYEVAMFGFRKICDGMKSTLSSQRRDEIRTKFLQGTR